MKAHIGLDFIDSCGHRNFCFQWCEPQPDGKLVALVCVDLNHNGEVERFAACPAYQKREYALIRLARKYFNQQKHA